MPKKRVCAPIGQIVHPLRMSKHRKTQQGGRAAGRSTAPAATAGSYHVVPPLAVVPQTSTITCWAAGFAIIYNWKNQRSLPIRDTLTALRNQSQYIDRFDRGEGLPWHWISGFATDARLAVEPTVNYNLQSWIDFIRGFGPILVNYGSPGAGATTTHMLVLEGIDTDGTEDGTEMHLADPLPGRIVIEPFYAFEVQYESVITSTGFAYPQVFHW
ncbi:papain-like cysteine protease family protein [Sorangium sp. So ce327]|uniref:papain-like cysteine protease family protein n=1 Tax=Sorangium sp. So ce327 TaxID=3133301 RepID=UPI003F6444F8